MPEKLEIEVVDRGASSTAGPPRPPSANVAAPARGPSPAASGGASAMQPAAPAVGPVTGPASTGAADSLVGIGQQLAGALGLAKPFAAVQQFLGAFRTQRPTAPAAAGGSIETHLVRVEALLGQIARNTGSASPQQPVRRRPAAQQPASSNLRNNPDLDEVFGAAPKPPAAAAAQAPSVAAPVAAEAGDAAELGEVAVGAEAAGVGLAGVAAVAAPVAVAFGAVYASIKLTEKAFQLAGTAAEIAGQQFSMLARNNYLGMFTQGLDLSAKSLGKVPIVGGMFGAALEAASTSVKAFSSVVGAFNERASELAGFSPEIMMAQQRQAITSLFGDMREAQELGPGLARMLDAETNLQRDLREMFLPIKKVIVEVLAKVLEGIDDHLPDIAKGLASMLEVLEAIVGILDKLTLKFGHGWPNQSRPALKKQSRRCGKSKRTRRKSTSA